MSHRKLSTIQIFCTNYFPLLHLLSQHPADGHPSNRDKRSPSICVCFFSLISLLFNATTTEMSSSKSCVVKNRLRLRFVKSSSYLCFPHVLTLLSVQSMMQKQKIILCAIKSLILYVIRFFDARFRHFDSKSESLAFNLVQLWQM